MRHDRDSGRLSWIEQLLCRITDALWQLAMMAESLEYDGIPGNDLSAEYYARQIISRHGLDRELVWSLAEAIHDYMDAKGYL